jgi:hypothetical protein
MKSDDVEVLQAKINKNSSIFIQPVNKAVSLDKPIYAINWFNTRQLWLYNLYNFLASKSLLKIKAAPFFKGLTQEVLYGEKHLRRDVVLIVAYPSCHAFKYMLESLYFQLVSVLRMAAVKSFGFGFFSPQDPLVFPESLPEKDDNSVYCFHHFTVADGSSTTQVLMDLKQVIACEASDNSDVTLIFDGGLGAHLYSGDHNNKEQIPCIMDGAIVIKANTVDTLKQLIARKDYQTVFEQTGHSFISTVKRVI